MYRLMYRLMYNDEGLMYRLKEYVTAAREHSVSVLH